MTNRDRENWTRRLIAEVCDGTPVTLEECIETLYSDGMAILTNDCDLLYNALLFKNVDNAKYLLSSASEVFVDPSSCDEYLPLAVGLGDVSLVERLLHKGSSANVPSGPRGSSPLHDAVSKNSAKIIKVLLDYGADVNAEDSNGSTPLHIAADMGDRAIVNLLLNNGASVYSTTATDITPLHVAAKRDRFDVVELLVRKGAWVDARTIHRLTPLHFAAEVGCAGIVQLLLCNGAEVNARTLNAWLPVHFAVEKSRKEAIELLLKNGSSVEIDNISHRTPLDIAVEKGDVEIVKLILEYCALSDLINYMYDTAFGIAIENGSKEIIQLLIAHAATWSNFDISRIPMCKAVVSGKIDIVELLLTTGVSVNDAQILGVTPLLAAADAGTKEMVEFLLDSGACVNGRIGCNTPLTAAAKKGRKDIVELLLSRGAYVNAEATSADSPLHQAVKVGCRDTVELLLSHGAGVNGGTPFYETPLYVACKGNSRAILDILLSLGASVNAMSGQHGTPLHVAIAMGDEDVVKLLLSRGASVNAASETFGTPLHVAAATGRLNMVEILLSRGTDVNIDTGKWGTPLHAAVMGDQYLKYFFCMIEHPPEHCRVSKSENEVRKDVVNLLLRNGANVNIKTVGFGYPLQVAASLGQSDTVDSLLNNGADVDAVSVDYGKDGPGRYRGTALYVAVREKRLEVVRVILSHNPDLNNDSNKEAMSVAVHDQSPQHDAIVNSLFRYGFTLKPDDARNPNVLRTALRNRRVKVTEFMFKTNPKENVAAMRLFLFDAVTYGGLEMIATLIRLGVDVNRGDVKRMTALHYVAHMNREQTISRETVQQTIEWLLSRGAQLEARAKGGKTPLLCAAEYGFVDMVEILAEKGASVNAVQDDGFSALHQIFLSAFQLADSVLINTAKLLLKLGADVNCQCRQGRPPLHRACYSDTVVDIFLRNGADVNAADNKGFTALHYAALMSMKVLWDAVLYKHVLKSTKIMLSRGANVNARSEDGTTPLHIACQTGNVELVAVLIEHAARLPAGCSRRTLTCLERLNVTMNAATKTGETPLHHAADIYLASECGKDPIFPRYSADIFEVNNMLLRNGAMVNAVTNKGLATPLHIAVKSQDENLVSLYLRFGADVNAKDACGYTPLHIACRHNKAAVVVTLLEYGADFNATKLDGASPLHCAKIGTLQATADNYHIESTQAFLTLLKHLIKMKAAGIHVSEQDLHYLKPEISEQYHAWYYSSEPDFPAFECYCQEEVSILKAEKAGNSSWSYYDILTADTSKLIIMTRDETILLEASSDVFKRKFPIYSNIILGNLRRGEVRGDLLQRSETILHILYPRLYLPDICTDNISSYLSNADLRMFIIAFCPPG